jgi:type III pantothenate kinase
MINLAIDIGNTRTKVAFFEVNKLMHEQIIDNENQWHALIKNFKPQYAVMSAVGAGADAVTAILSVLKVSLLQVNYQTPLPFTINYNTPQTLGMDRVAAIAAAQFLYPNINCLVIDAGTCITYDFISADISYQGGAIAPGMHMRLQAMHEFTHKLPLPNLNWPEDFEGKSTEQSLLSGVCIGVADEINGRIARYTERYGQLQVIICGGNSHLLAKHIKNNIFAAPSLVLMGLNQILLFNVK